MEEFEIVDFEGNTPESGTETFSGGGSSYEPVEDGEHIEEPKTESTPVNTDDLSIETEADEESLSFEDYMELEFFTGESFPSVLSTTIIGGFGLFTICFLIGFGILKVVSLFNINNEKGD